MTGGERLGDRLSSRLLSQRWKPGPRAIEYCLLGILEPAASIFLFSVCERPVSTRIWLQVFTNMCSWEEQIVLLSLSFNTVKISSSPGPHFIEIRIPDFTNGTAQEPPLMFSPRSFPCTHILCIGLEYPYGPNTPE